ncbi:MAG TPA: DUF4214 domain-containing protein [Gemmataceae bacterium]|nr:DUF4214 domain-containing protein [Gemmataceae bacterium]
MLFLWWRGVRKNHGRTKRFKGSGKLSQAYRPALEVLENRWAPAVVTVTTTADDLTPNDGSVSLREAITAINAGSTLGDPDISAQNPGTFGINDKIAFNIPQPGGGPTVQTINVGGSGNGAFPALTRPVLLDGYSEAGASANTLPNSDNANILIELSGASAGPNANGLTLGTGGGITVQGLAVNRFSANGILVKSSHNTVAGNFIGTNPAGTVAEPNGLDGVRIDSASNNTIGGTTVDARNVVSGNSLDGIHIVGSANAPTSNLVQGNFVGVNAAGTGSVGVRPAGSAAGTVAGNFRSGIEISGGVVNTIGGSSPGAGNVIGYNLDGIELDNGAQNNVIQGNFSGLGADGVTNVGNLLHGIVLRNDGNLPPPLGPGQIQEPPVSQNLIGGIASAGASPGNVVAFNGTGGVAIFSNPGQNNFVQVQNSGNAIEGNSIYANGRSDPTTLIGIDLTNQFVYPRDDGVTPNDSGKNRSGMPAPHGDPSDPNNFQNFPVLTSITVTKSAFRINGTFTQGVSPNTNFRIEFFLSNPDSAGGIPEGQTFIGSTNVLTDFTGKATIAFTPTVNLTLGQLVTATATDPNGNTSEFSAAVQLPTPLPSITSLNPALTTEGVGPLTLTVTGTNFVGTSVVFVNGAPQATTFVSSTQLSAALPAALTADEGTLAVTVQNPPPSGGVSNARQLSVLETLLPDGSRGTPNQRFISEVYHDLLKRPVDASGLATWTALLNQGTSRNQVILMVESNQEYHAVVVQELYQTLLHRPADQTGLTGFVNLLGAGGTVEQVKAALAGSREYFVNRGGGTNDGFLNAIYGDFLNRAPDDAGRAAWDHALATGTTTGQVAAAILNTTEYRQNLVAGFYLQYLERNADQAGLNALVNMLSAGARDEQVLAIIVASDEFFNKTL